MSECDDDKDYNDDRDNNSSSDDQHEASLPPMLADDAVSVDSSGHKVYKYRDFGDLEDEEDAAGRVPSSATAPSTRGSGESSIRVQKFPVKLYAILAQKEFHEIISWMPHGRAWKVLKASMFESLVMPLFFEYSNYHSFNRLVNAWSFRRVSSGPDRGAYYHEVRNSRTSSKLVGNSVKFCCLFAHLFLESFILPSPLPLVSCSSAASPTFTST
jgi:HSF-type DNA-binding